MSSRDSELTQLAKAAGTGSYDGIQENALHKLLALLTARRAIELYPFEDYLDTDVPQGTYRRAIVKYNSDIV